MTDEGAGSGATAEGGTETPEREGKLPRVAMLFSTSHWTVNVRLSRSGREEGEGIILMGEVSFRAATGERRIFPARAMVVKSDARKRLDIVLSPQETVMTIPLEPFALQRMQDRLKDLVSYYGMTLRIAFAAADTPDRQGLEYVDFAFTSGQRPAQQAKAQGA